MGAIFQSLGRTIAAGFVLLVILFIAAGTFEIGRASCRERV